jgi:hypothetical protein
VLAGNVAAGMIVGSVVPVGLALLVGNAAIGVIAVVAVHPMSTGDITISASKKVITS